MIMKNYLFDFDGTLADSMPTFVGVMLRVMRENGLTPAPDTVRIITPLGYGGTAEYFRSLGVKLPAEELVARMHELATEDYEQRIHLKEGVADTLRTLRESGCSLNVLTASPHGMLDPCLKRCGVYDLFDNVWSCEDFGRTKSDPEIYREAAGRMGVPIEQVTFVDDNLGACTVAKSAGAITVGIYDDSSAEAVEAMRARCDGYVFKLAELIERAQK